MELKNKIRDNSGVLIFLLFSTLFFILQHNLGISWDFAVYVLNSKYLFNNGYYFEWERAPLMPLLLFLFSLLGYKLSEYIYIIFVSGLFSIACVKVAYRVGVDKNVFYALMLSPFLLNYSFISGTELLSLSLLMLAISSIQEKNSSFYMGLSLLARYLSLPYILLFTAKKRKKDILLAFIIIFLLYIPWMMFNQISRGHPFYSMASSLFLNLKGKSPGHYGPELSSLPISLWLIFGLALLGFGLKFKDGLRNIDYLIIGFTIIIAASYMMLTVTELRYLFNLTLPIGYFAAYAIKSLNRDGNAFKNYLIVYSVLFMNFKAASSHAFIRLSLPSGFYDGVQAVRGPCMAASNAWPYLNYVDIVTQPYPPKEHVGWYIKQGYRILLFYGGDIPKPEYMYDEDFMRGQPKIKSNRDYILLGNASVCAHKEILDKSFIDYYNMRGNNITLCPLLPITC